MSYNFTMVNFLRKVAMQDKNNPTFVDLFSGCGGLSLGLFAAGWHGIFAVEKSADAFKTLNHNLCSHLTGKYQFDWPEWLPVAPITVSELIAQYEEKLSSLADKIDLLAGGPPCQGFSTAGKRNPDDPRNSLVKEYLEVVNLLKPRIILIENVKGFTAGFKDRIKSNVRGMAYSELVEAKLKEQGYFVFSRLVCCSDFGVPQYRKRFIMIGIKKADPILQVLGHNDPIIMLLSLAQSFRIKKGIGSGITVSAKEAISDLEIARHELIPHKGPLKGFKQIDYREPDSFTAYQKLMRRFSKGKAPNSLRLARHTNPVVERFKKIQSFSSLGRSLSKEDRNKFGIKKHSTTPLHPHLPSATITTLPDDIIHYSEPRILTVRENARLQSFPDWFQFKGKYTTGGKQRKLECPRYTQVGNAVPPLLSEAIGLFLKKLLSQKNEDSITSHLSSIAS